MKRTHRLHAASGPDDFQRRFEREVGRPVSAFVDEVASPPGVLATILGGTIPLGIATTASDIDLIVVVESREAARENQVGTNGIIFNGEWPGDEFALTNIVLDVPPVELDVVILLAPGVRELTERLERGNVSLSRHQIVFLSRLKTGWLLQRQDEFATAHERLCQSNALELHCAVRQAVIATKALSGARAALEDNVPLALHLGRVCVESWFEAYLASRGYAFLGVKWLRFLARHQHSGEPGSRALLDEVISRGIPLMFPMLEHDAAHANRYLQDVAEFANLAKRLIASEPAFRIALELAPHIRRSTS